MSKKYSSNIEREIDEILEKYEETKFTLWDYIKFAFCSLIFAFTIIPRYISACISDYINTLDEYDKSVVMTYLSTKYHPFKKKEKNK